MLAHKVIPLKGGIITCYLLRRLQLDVHSSLVTFALSVWPETTQIPDPYHKLVFWSLYSRCRIYFTKSFNVVTSNLYLVYFVPQRDLCIVYCAHKTKLIITRKVFIKLCYTQICLKQTTRGQTPEVWINTVYLGLLNGTTFLPCEDCHFVTHTPALPYSHIVMIIR